MIIIFGNQKGGTGKSTLAVLFSNYLSLVKNKEVAVFDMDFQRSLHNKAKSTTVLENDLLYSVKGMDLKDFKSIKKDDSFDTRINIIDLAGKLDDDNLIPIFRESDLILTPFAYDEYSVSSTIEFCIVVKKVNPKANIVLIPNRIKKNVKYETLESVNEALSNFGLITHPISERIDFQRITLLTIPDSIIAVIEPIFESIYNEFILQCQTTI